MRLRALKSLRLHRMMATSAHPLPPASRPAHWKSLAPAPSNSTDASSLPRLPVPKLADTLSKLKASLEPLAGNASEIQEANRKIDEFGSSDIASRLQAGLEKRQAESEHWLEQWWDDGGYMTYRDSVVINVSYYYGFIPKPAAGSSSYTPSSLAARIALAGMHVRAAYNTGSLPPEATKEGPICMDTYRYMFDCCRAPGTEGADWYVSYADLNPSKGHVVFVRKGRMWRVDMFDAQGSMVPLDNLEQTIQRIYKESDDRKGAGVGVLAAGNRDTWAQDYVELTSDPHNEAILKDIHSAAFIVALDASSPSDDIAHARELWHGKVTDKHAEGLANRWVDKPCEFIVFDNGYAGLMGEHAVMDGTPTVRLCDEVIALIASPKLASTSSSAAPEAKPLDWNISVKTSKALEQAHIAAADLANTQELNMLRTGYGKSAIKAFRVSPDSWAQMIVQLAYARLTNGARAATYEAASTRRFHKGRTEAIRVLSSESAAWVDAMLDSSKTKAEKKAAFDKATAAHMNLAKAAGKGMGVDRHLFGLKKLFGETEAGSGAKLPELFEDPLVMRSSYWILSTSAIFSKHFLVYGWGEVVPDGFGVAYMTGFDDYLQYTITSRKEMPNKQFCEEIDRAARDLYELHADEKARL